MLVLKEVNAYYGHNHVLKSVSLDVDKAGLVTLIGANGAGKTTTLRSISGLVRIRSGAIAFDQHALHSMTPDQIAELGIAHVPEGRRVFPKMSVLENLETGAYVLRAKQSSADFRDNLQRVYNLFPLLSARRKQLSGTLSGGEQQMLAIGRALMSKPQFILFDEPSLGLAPLIVKAVFETIESIHREGLGMLIVEQNAAMALNLAQYGYVMELGEIRHHGTATSLRSNEVVVSAYLGKERR